MDRRPQSSLLVHVAAALDQYFGEGRVVGAGCHKEDSLLVDVLAFIFNTCFEEQLRDFFVALPDGYVERTSSTFVVWLAASM